MFSGVKERVMRKLLIVLASTTALAMPGPVTAQTYLPPVAGGGAFNPDFATGSYTAPGYTAPGYTAPTYRAPGYAVPGYAAPGYTWREQRANEDWRNNTWREQRYDEDWRNNNWRNERANQDWRQREDYAKQSTPNNVIDRGYISGATATDTVKNYPTDKDKECAVGSPESAKSCLDYARDKTKIYRSTDGKKSSPIGTTTYPNYPTYPAYPTNERPIGGR
jgi:hypothetical protein